MFVFTQRYLKITIRRHQARCAKASPEERAYFAERRQWPPKPRVRDREAYNRYMRTYLRATRPVKGTQRCGLCGMDGHNRRTCFANPDRLDP